VFEDFPADSAAQLCEREEQNLVVRRTFDGANMQAAGYVIFLSFGRVVMPCTLVFDVVVFR
jgi:hypothetical protein